MSLNKQTTSKMSQNNQAQWAFDTNSRNENGIVVCIPRVFKNIRKERIFACMINTQWGQIEKVDLIEGESFNKAFIHFVPNKFNIKNHNAEQALKRMLKGEQVIFTYDVNEKHPEGWFWKIGISKSVRPKFRKQRKNPARRKIRLDLSGKNTKVKITDADLLLRKNVNQKVITEEIPVEDGTQYLLKGPYGETSKIEFQAYQKKSNQKVVRVGDDPIMARALLNSPSTGPAIKRQYSLHPSQVY